MSRAQPQIVHSRASLSGEDEGTFVYLDIQLTFETRAAATHGWIVKRYGYVEADLREAFERHMRGAAERFVYQSQMFDYL